MIYLILGDRCPTTLIQIIRFMSLIKSSYREQRYAKNVYIYIIYTLLLIDIIYFRSRNFHGQKVSRFLRFLAFFAKFSAKAWSKFKILESICSRNYGKFSNRESFSIRFFSFLQVFALLFPNHPNLWPLGL